MLYAKQNKLALIIEEDYPEVGVYLYVYENGQCIRDELQDNIDIFKEQAFEEYDVPLDAWREQEEA